MSYLINGNVSVFHTKVDYTVKKAKEIDKKHPFEAILCQGLSGASVGFPVAYLMNKPIVQIRKYNENSHGSPIEGDWTCNKFLIIDDFIDSGRTIARMLDVVYSSGKSCIGILLYQSKSKDRIFNVKKLYKNVKKDVESEKVLWFGKSLVNLPDCNIPSIPIYNIKYE